MLLGFLQFFVLILWVGAIVTEWYLGLGPFTIILTTMAGLGLHFGLSAMTRPRYRPYRETSPEQRRLESDKRAYQALRQKRPLEALQMFEEAHNYGKALELATELGDLETQGRLLLKMGQYAQARQIFLQAEDFYHAGCTALLMRNLEEARKHFATSAQRCADKQVRPAEEAALWDRAGDFEKASRLYEEGGQLSDAAICYEAQGEAENARHCHAQAEAMAAFERKQAGLTVAAQMALQRERAAAATIKAEQAKMLGDFFEAGQQYLKAENWMEAALCFEHCGQNHRAALAFRKAGMSDRADMLDNGIRKKPEPPPAQPEAPAPAPRQHEPMPAPPTRKPDSASMDTDDGMPPSTAPRPSGAFKFVPIERLREVPVFVAAAGWESTNPQAMDELAQNLRRGKFREAAEKAIEAGNWTLGAALFECAGELIRAADVYRQVGRSFEATDCLDKAGRHRHSALMRLAEGRQDLAISRLLEPEPEALDNDSALLLLKLLIDWERTPEALELLSSGIAPHGPTPSRAAVFYCVGRLLENRGARSDALEMYQRLLNAGHVSPDLQKREARLLDTIATEIDESPLEDQITHTALDRHQEEAIDMSVVQALSRLRSRPPVAPGDDADPDTDTDTETGSSGGIAIFATDELPRIFEEWIARLDPLQGGALIEGELSLFGLPAPALAPGDGSDDQGDGDGDGDGEKTVPVFTDPFETAIRYEKKQQIGRGGMGVVYEAQDLILQRNVALKLLHASDTDPDNLRQFLLEARAIAQLSHPNVVTLFDVGLMGARHYIAMELVDGGSVSALVRQKGRLAVGEALRLFLETAQGLQAAHEAGIIHRDIKPANLLINAKRHIKIVDFGLAKITRGAAQAEDRTIFRSSGTPGYMAPEQIRGEELTPGCDIYALGICLFYMLVGKPPHKAVQVAGDFDTLKFHIDGKLPSIRDFRTDIGPAVDDLYRYCVATDPEARYASVGEFIQTVRELLVNLDLDDDAPPTEAGGASSGSPSYRLRGMATQPLG